MLFKCFRSFYLPQAPEFGVHIAFTRLCEYLAPLTNRPSNKPFSGQLIRATDTPLNPEEQRGLEGFISFAWSTLLPAIPEGEVQYAAVQKAASLALNISKDSSWSERLYRKALNSNDSSLSQKSKNFLLRVLAENGRISKERIFDLLDALQSGTLPEDYLQGVIVIAAIQAKENPDIWSA